MLEVGLANDAAVAVRRALLVALRELFEAEHAPPASREVIERRAAHGAESDDDGVVVAGVHDSGAPSRGNLA